MLRIVVELVRFFGCGRRGAERSITGDAVRAFGRVKIELSVASARERKLLFVAPDVVPHNEETNWSSTRVLVFHSLERVVEPLQSSRCMIQHGSFTEHNVADLSLA